MVLSKIKIEFDGWCHLLDSLFQNWRRFREKQLKWLFELDMSLMLSQTSLDIVKQSKAMHSKVFNKKIKKKDKKYR